MTNDKIAIMATRIWANIKKAKIILGKMAVSFLMEGINMPTYKNRNGSANAFEILPTKNVDIKSPPGKSTKKLEMHINKKSSERLIACSRSLSFNLFSRNTNERGINNKDIDKINLNAISVVIILPKPPTSQ